MKNCICDICGKEFVRINNNQFHCSLKCKNKFYYQNNKQRILIKVKNYQILNKEKILKQKREHYSQFLIKPEKIKYRTNIQFRLTKILRSRIYDVLKEINKSESTLKLLGCSLNNFKIYLESQFKSGMNWSNLGRGWNGKGMKEWHIDHIKPCASFDLSKEEEQKKCFHYTNLQPLWAKENRIKYNN